MLSKKDNHSVNQLHAEAIATLPCKTHIIISRKSENFFKREDEISKYVGKWKIGRNCSEVNGSELQWREF